MRNNYRRRRMNESVGADIIQLFEDYGFYDDDGKNKYFFYDDMPFRFYVMFNAEDGTVSISFNPAGTSYDCYYADVDTYEKADNFLMKLHNWEEYNSDELLAMGLKAMDFEERTPWIFYGQTQFGSNVMIDLRDWTCKDLDDPDDELYDIYEDDGLDEIGLFN